jgi:DNA-binding transcriptional MocR family regulator
LSEARSVQAGQHAWTALVVPGKGARYLQIADAIEQALLEGSLRPGERLPTQRALAQLLQVDLNTITRAYDEARRRHLLEGRGALGTYAAAPKVALDAVLDLEMNMPPPPEGSDFGDLLKQGLTQVLMRSEVAQLMSYHSGGGNQADHAAAQRWLAPILGRSEPARLLVAPGAQAALVAITLSETAPGELILAEPALYPGLRVAAARLGRRIASVPVDGDGMLPDALDELCARLAPRLIYLNPTLQNPTTATMPLARRKAVLDVARRHGVWVVEDDPYWLLAAAPPPPLAALAPDQVFYIATLSKCLSPGLQTAYVHTPNAAARDQLLRALRSFALMAPPLSTAVATQWIHDGGAAQLLQAVKAEASARQAIAGELLAGRSNSAANRAAEGIHIWLPLPGYWTAADLARAAAAAQLAVSPSAIFHEAGDGAPPPPNALRVSLGGIQERGRLRTALRRLSALLARRPSASEHYV